MAVIVRPELTDKQRVQCTYCERVVGMWGGSREMYRHNMPNGVRCPGSATKGWRRFDPPSRRNSGPG